MRRTGAPSGADGNTQRSDAPIAGQLLGRVHEQRGHALAAEGPGHGDLVNQGRGLAAGVGLRLSPPPCHDGVMGSQRFRGVVVAGARDGAAIMMPFDPDEAWGAKADHPVSGTVGGCRIRTRLVPGGGGWMLILAPKRLISMG